MRLFCVRDAKGDIATNGPKPLFFASKKEAKSARDERGEGYRVSRGPDHWRGASR